MTQHIAVLMGGWSAEREISLRSGKACADALERIGFRITAARETVAKLATAGTRIVTPPTNGPCAPTSPPPTGR